VQPDFRYKALVEEASGGRLIIDHKIDVVGDTQVAVAVIDGRFDMGRFYAPWVSGTFPLWDYGSLPFFFDNLYDYERAQKDPRLIALLEKSYSDIGLVQLADLASDGTPVVWSNEPMGTVASFKGMKVRGAGLLATYGLELLGASPLTIPGAEIAESLRRGTIDAVLTDRVWALTIGMADVSSYLNMWDFIVPFSAPVVINKEKFESLPADLQQILRDASKDLERQTTFATVFGAQLATMCIELIGLEIVYPDKAELAKARELTKPAVDKYIKVAGADGAALINIISDYGAK